MDVEMDKSGIGHGRGRLLRSWIGLRSGLRRKPPRMPTRAAMVKPCALAVHAERGI
jgi:hypothetical protein